MYVSLTDILAAVSTVVVGLIGVLLLVIKLINRRRRGKKTGEHT
jgi:hypothetical protein